MPDGQALGGIQWYNGSASDAFAKLLVAAGDGDLPPAYEEAVTVAENVRGQEDGWSTVEFSEPVASLSGTLFVILQLPPFYVPPAEGSSLGVGYREFDGEGSFYVSGDGDHWLKLSSGYELLLKPDLVEGDPMYLAKSAPADEGKVENLPQITKVAFHVYPNPFNPEAKLVFELPKSARCEVRVYDLRGLAVRELFEGGLPAGVTELRWDGRDNAGRMLSSGVYWAKATAGDLSFTERMVMIK